MVVLPSDWLKIFNISATTERILLNLTRSKYSTSSTYKYTCSCVLRADSSVRMTALASDWLERFPFLQGGKLYLGGIRRFVSLVYDWWIWGNVCFQWLINLTIKSCCALREHSLEVGLTENLDWSIVLCCHLHAITILFCGGKIGLIYSTSFSSIHDDMNLRISYIITG